MTKKKQNQIKNETKVINPDEKKNDPELVEQQKRVDFTSVEIKRTLERYNTAIVPFFKQKSVAGLLTGLEASWIIAPIIDDKNEKK